MEIITNGNDQTLTISLDGRMDTLSAPKLQKELEGASEDVQLITLDFSNLEYMSSAGLRVLLLGHRRMESKGGQLLIKNISPILMEIFTATGFNKVLHLK